MLSPRNGPRSPGGKTANKRARDMERALLDSPSGAGNGGNASAQGSNSNNHNEDQEFALPGAAQAAAAANFASGLHQDHQQQQQRQQQAISSRATASILDNKKKKQGKAGEKQGGINSGVASTASTPGAVGEGEGDDEDGGAMPMDVSGDPDARTTVMTQSKADAVVTFVYVPGGSFPDLTPYIGSVIEVRVAAPYITLRLKEMSTRQLWGTRIYTDDSDMVAMLMHCGEVNVSVDPPHDIVSIAAFLKVSPGQARYESSEHSGLRSRPWASKYDRCSLELVRTERMEKGNIFSPRAKPRRAAAAATKEGEEQEDQTEVIQMLDGRPYRAILGGATRRNKRAFVPNVVLLHRPRGAPRLKYSLGLIADRGMAPETWTSTRLRTQTIYLEECYTGVTYELSCVPNGRSKNRRGFDAYRWASVKTGTAGEDVSSRKRQKGSNGANTNGATDHGAVPRATGALRVLETGLDWDEIEWGPASVMVRGKEYVLQSMVFLPNTTA